MTFAWSEPAARFVRHQIDVLGELACEPAVPFLPEVVAAGTDFANAGLGEPEYELRAFPGPAWVQGSSY